MTVFERLTTLECLIIVYTRNMFFDKISLVHAVIKHYTIFAEAPAEARFFFLPENFWKFGKINFVFLRTCMVAWWLFYRLIAVTMYNVNKLVLYMYVVSIESKKWYFLLFWQKRDFLSYTIIRHLHDFIHLPIFPHSRLIRTTRLLGTLE